MNSTLTIFLGVIILGMLIKFTTKLILKVLGFVVLVAVVIGAMYAKGIGPFKDTQVGLDALTEKYCGNPEEEAICECILQKAERDMRNRFTEDELDSLQADRIRAAYVLKRSLDATKNPAMQCLETKGMEHKYQQFINDFIPIENEHLNVVGDKAKEWSEKLKQEAQDLLLNKDNIDSRY